MPQKFFRPRKLKVDSTTRSVLVRLGKSVTAKAIEEEKDNAVLKLAIKGIKSVVVNTEKRFVRQAVEKAGVELFEEAIKECGPQNISFVLNNESSGIRFGKIIKAVGDGKILREILKEFIPVGRIHKLFEWFESDPALFRTAVRSRYKHRASKNSWK
ncbi:MAG: hypothetical protein Q7S21_07495 [archaeon]|nr:hypothetical protein [archaeon]